MTPIGPQPNPDLESLRASLRARAELKDRHDAGWRPPVYDEVVLDEELGPVSVRVDEEAVKACAFALDDHGPWYFGPSPFGGSIGQAAILANDLLCVYYTHYDRHRVVGLHTEEVLEFHAPVRVGETATIDGRYVDKYEDRGRGYVDLVAEARGEDGRLLVRHRGVEIMRVDPGDVVSEPKAGAASERPPAPVGSGRIDTSFEPGLAPVAAVTEGLRTGTPLVPRHKMVTADMISVYSFGGEFLRNIHTDLEIARGGGLERPIAQGQQQASLLCSYAVGLFGATWFTSGRLRAKFVQPLPSNSAITIGGRVAGSEEDGRLSVELWLDRGDGVLSAVAWASALPG
jgi:acyl dehydratase